MVCDMKIMDFLYDKALRPMLFKCDPEKVHDAFVAVGAFAGRFSITRASVSFLYGYHGRDISKTVDGIQYRLPVLLSAGFDPDGQLTQILKSVSFGGEEVGSTTALPCEGNQRPRLTRLIRNKSIVVYKGLRNKGVDALIAHLSHTKRVSEYVIGISIARTNVKISSVDVEAGIADYALSFQKLNRAGVGDYYTINISCPNTFDGEAFTDPALLARLLARLREVPCSKPIYLKMPINMEWDVFSQLLDIADRNAISGVIIGNLNKSYEELDHPEDAPKEFRGGLSGKPCFLRSNDFIRKTREKYGNRFTIIGAGGIFTPEDAMEKFRAGSDLIMLVSGMIFEGPGLMHKICKRYAQEIK
jgi:dihydroorotate dehydrogenase